ncbi:unnamed protein product, partial [Discosporangium mesarthrocarpum]
KILARLLRSYDSVCHFIRSEGHVALLSLPGVSVFKGSTALLAGIFRHLLEDPATLQSAMETEIRSTFARLARSGG